MYLGRDFSLDHHMAKLKLLPFLVFWETEINECFSKTRKVKTGKEVRQKSQDWGDSERRKKGSRWPSSQCVADNMEGVLIGRHMPFKYIRKPG